MRSMFVIGLLTAGVALGAVESVLPTSAEHRGEIEKWRSERLGRLKDPNGWLSLVGLHWLEPGWQTVGSDPGNDIQLSVGPKLLGRIGLVEGRVHLETRADAGATIEHAATNAAASQKGIELAPDSSGQPSIVRFGSSNFVVIERSGRFGLRVKDPEASTRTGFTGLDQFPIDVAWKLEATFEPHAAGKTIDIASVINTIEPMPNPGAVVFKKDGKQFRLEAVDEGDGQLFLIFADRTNGKTTYGPGRFLYADKPVNNRTVVDFNRAYNPPCAFNAYSTCPLPPPENRLDVAVDAGEKNYASVAAH